MSKIKNIFQNSPVSPLFIAESITKHSTKTEIGAHQIFLGQIRADEVDGKTVKAIEYTAYQDLALSQMAAIREEIFEKYDITCMHIYHSLGTVHVGEICLFVFTSSKHRNEATMACNEVVERIKNELPIWGKEIFEDETHQWKINQ
ncbi:molybdenum cofactor biosynthesis protein MoaE [Chryseobacterium sp. CFS15]|uniref:molybdenum cofactor biosynthesis protein MoaE n=1 Tax=Chryseobacterium sp. CFS15 TaxID=2986946 RepID=UPI002807C626|nr:molybdenum cofactor biosynthesis protein MoaE [Chryseobacterium sp. CFS15]MDQ8143217.1 molybdenum cofactor biosynthesis protein MoaE [Chryseobacterium sp. CFS15]